jgi:hypothetical protein
MMSNCLVISSCSLGLTEGRKKEPLLLLLLLSLSLSLFLSPLAMSEVLDKHQV